MTATERPSNALDVNRIFYRKHAREFCHNTAEFDMTALYAPFLALLPCGARILDAGCGSGRDSEAFQKMGYRVTAIDASPEMVAITHKKGVEAQLVTFQQMDFSEAFDGIWACASLLHVPHVEMPNVLCRLVAALRECGTLYVSLKEGSGEYTTPDGRFFSYFSLDQFTGLLRAEPRSHLVEFWRTEDMFAATSKMWLNFIIQKLA